MSAIVRHRDTPLLRVEKARAMLVEARSLDDVKKIRDVAVAMKAYARTQQAGRDIAIDAGEIILRADVRFGELAKQLPKAANDGTRNGRRQSSPMRGPDKRSALAELHVSKQRASEMERASSLPARDLDRYVAASRRSGQAPSTGGAVALAQLTGARRDETLAKLGNKPDVAKAIRRATSDARRAQLLDKLAAISKGNNELLAPQRFPVLLADPPWQYDDNTTDPTRVIENQYPTMPIEELCALPVGGVTTDDAILFLWVTSPLLAKGVRLIQAWGFAYQTSMVWVKDKIGMGYFARQRHELLLIATKGNVPKPAPADRPDSVIEAPRTEHSAKPDRAYELIERMYPTLPRMEMFCRAPREGWFAWGNQAQ